jgi:hypothetical protein
MERVTAQTYWRWLLSAEPRVPRRAIPCEIHGGRTDTIASFSRISLRLSWLL